jgi:hypothetical protein
MGHLARVRGGFRVAVRSLMRTAPRLMIARAGSRTQLLGLRPNLVLALLAALSASAAPKLVIVDAPPLARRAIEAAFPRGSVVKGASFDSRDAKGIMRVTRAARAAAAVKASTKARQVVVELFNAADGASLARVVLPAPKRGPLKALPRPAVAALLRALARAQPGADGGTPTDAPVATPRSAPKELPLVGARPAEPQPETREVVPTVVATAEPRREDTPPDALQFRVGPRIFQRSLTWTDDLFKQLSTYGLPAAPAVSVEARFFPGALFTSGVLANLGVAAAFEQSLGVKSTDSEGESYATGAMRFRVGALARIPVSRVTLMPHAGWSMQAFTIAETSTNGTPRLLPNVRYGTLRAGLLAAVQLIGPLALEAGAAYQLVLSAGQLASTGYFPKTTVGGADFEVAAVLRLTRHFEVRLSAEYLRFWMSLNVKPGDPWIAGGALDEYTSLLLTAAFVL